MFILAIIGALVLLAIFWEPLVSLFVFLLYIALLGVLVGTIAAVGFAVFNAFGLL